MLLKKGSTGDLVKKLQEKLGLTADGVFGFLTENSVKDWQSKNGLIPDGLVGEKTLDKLGISERNSETSTPQIQDIQVNFEALSGKVPASILALLPEAFLKYGINTDLEASHFLAQIAHESGEFTIKTESMKYTTPQRIVDIWPSRFNLDGSGGKKNANEYTKNEEKLAEAVYGGRMGNNNPGDGFRFRGGGFLQLTGKDAYKEYAAYLGKSVEETADLIRSDNYYALDSALWEYCINMKLNVVASTGTSQDVVKKISRTVNGGLIGIDERIEKFNKYYSLLS